MCNTVLFKVSFYIQQFSPFIYVQVFFVCKHSHTQHICGGETSAFSSWFSPASTGDPGTKRRSDSKQLGHLTPSLSSVFLKLHYFSYISHICICQFCVCTGVPRGSWTVRSAVRGFYPPGHLALFLVFFFFFQISLCMCVCSKAHVWRSEDNLWESTLP